jgi:hypothetical protein
VGYINADGTKDKSELVEMCKKTEADVYAYFILDTKYQRKDNHNHFKALETDMREISGRRGKIYSRAMPHSITSSGAMSIGGMTTVITERIRKYHTFIDDPRKLARGAHVHIRKGNEECYIGGGYNKSDGEGIARILKEHIGKTNIVIKEIASKGAGYSRIFGGDMIMDWDNTSTINEERRWEEALANTERAAPGQYTYIISGEQRPKIDWAVVEGAGHINAKQISDNPPGLSKRHSLGLRRRAELGICNQTPLKLVLVWSHCRHCPPFTTLLALATGARATFALASSSRPRPPRPSPPYPLPNVEIKKRHAKRSSARLARQHRPSHSGFGRTPSGPTDHAGRVPGDWAQEYGTSTSEMERDARVHCTHSCIFATSRSRGTGW